MVRAPAQGGRGARSPWGRTVASVPRPWCCRGRALAGVDGEGRAAPRPGSAPGASRPPPRPPRPCGGRWGGWQAAETQAFPAGPRALQTPAVWEPVWLLPWQRRPPRPDDTASSSGSLVGPEPVFFHASPVSAAQWEAGAGAAWGCLPTGPPSPGGADRRGADSPRRRGGTWLNRAHRPRGPSAPQGPPRDGTKRRPLEAPAGGVVPGRRGGRLTSAPEQPGPHSFTPRRRQPLVCKRGRTRAAASQGRGDMGPAERAASGRLRPGTGPRQAAARGTTAATLPAVTPQGSRPAAGHGTVRPRGPPLLPRTLTGPTLPPSL